jgi:hypothetical protein
MTIQWCGKWTADYVVAWKVTEDEPREVERRMIVAFVAEYGRRPFANLKD